jgi:DeoR/GlpR family transcriptional regulator of sugar metabolism
MNTLRQLRIKEYIEHKSVASIKELHALFPEVSLMTIHRDLDVLERNGALVKVRGGAKAVRHSADLGFDIRLEENIDGKTVIAAKALQLIQPHSSVFLDAGTTNLILARKLPDVSLNIVTTGPNVAIELCHLSNPTVTLCCGTINRKNQALSGRNTLEMLERINIDTAFIGVSGCSAESGFTCGTEADMLVKQLVIQKARTSVIVCDQTKFSQLMPYTFASFADVDYLVCDGNIPQAVADAAERQGLTIL